MPKGTAAAVPSGPNSVLGPVASRDLRSMPSGVREHRGRTDRPGDDARAE